ncbi:hypothetical protein F511_08610 [Dorcoceras hygrometricum]|uniref:Uncharacterized protein n=1 Tax=Dorcoceras hygrometricum TaxID=472368 RepID=A0A2Z7CQ58_9LAMI|nr:hypothetical protein F511_08610 [Dorcoceras hygrometricum]
MRELAQLGQSSPDQWDQHNPIPICTARSISIARSRSAQLDQFSTAQPRSAWLDSDQHKDPDGSSGEPTGQHREHAVIEARLMARAVRHDRGDGIPRAYQLPGLWPSTRSVLVHTRVDRRTGVDMARLQLEKAQKRMKKWADARRRKQEYSIGDKELIKHTIGQGFYLSGHITTSWGIIGLNVLAQR